MTVTHRECERRRTVVFDAVKVRQAINPESSQALYVKVRTG